MQFVWPQARIVVALQAWSCRVAPGAVAVRLQSGRVPRHSPACVLQTLRWQHSTVVLGMATAMRWPMCSHRHPWVFLCLLCRP